MLKGEIYSVALIMAILATLDVNLPEFILTDKDFSKKNTS
jgi:hypothetical protein